MNMPYNSTTRKSIVLNGKKIQNKEKRPELLVPLNSWKSLAPELKVLDYADAAYFGLQTKFTMRARATNFPLEDLEKLVSHLHSYNVKAYLTTNTLIYNMELAELHQLLVLAKKSKVDAVICHDIAAIMVAKDVGLPFHVSTQANISNIISAKFYESLGAERIILARELDLDDIKEIVKNVSIPVETFVHGAMCTAVSGRCYLSSELMGFKREFSANRGKCIQPCRRMFRFIGEEGEEIHFEPETGMFFNAKDLCMIAYVPDLIKAGIQSFKIEGRMRDPLYLSETVRCYKEAIDSYFDGDFTQEKVTDWISSLEQVFNRGFHTGFYFDRPSPNEIQFTVRGSLAKKKKKLIGKVKNYYSKACAVEVELHAGFIEIGDELLFENQADFFYKMKLKEERDLRLENEPIKRTPLASKEKHILIGIKVSKKVPINAQVFKMIQIQNQ